MIGMSYYQILEHLEESQFLEINVINADMVKARVLVLLSKSELPQATSSSMLVHMMDSTDNTACKSDTKKTSKPEIITWSFQQN